MTNDTDQITGLGLAWKMRWVLLAIVLVSAAAGLPFILSAPREFQSHAQVVIPATDPVTTRTTQASAVTIQLQQYAQDALADQVRAALGDQASALRSVSGVQQRTEDVYVVSADSTVPSVAVAAVKEAGSALIDRSNKLALQQVQRLREEIGSKTSSLTQHVAALDERRHLLAGRVAASTDELRSLLKSPSASGQATIKTLSENLKRLGAALSHTESRIQFLRSRLDSLYVLGEQATEEYLKRQAASTLVSAPSAATSGLITRVLSTVGLAVLVGLTVGVLMILWIDRRHSRKRERAGAEAPSPQSGREQLELLGGGSDKRGVRRQ